MDMAVELVGGAFLSSLFQSVFEKIAYPDVVDYFKQKRLDHKLLKKMKTVLLSLNPVINDAENKQIESQHVKAWYEELKEAVSDADQVLDEINTEALRCRMDGDFEGRPIKRPKSTWFSLFKRDRKDNPESKIEEILERLQDIIERKDLLGLEVSVLNRPLQRLPSPLMEEPIVYGMDDEKEKIIQCLLPSETADENVSIVSIVGMGGIGKTTLAQLVYNDIRVQESFDIRAWITVSDEFDIPKITKAILKIVTSQNSYTDDLYPLQVRLKEALKMKKFLFVLDDVWNENYNLWNVLTSPLESAANGSKIVLTTRSQIVASVTGSVLERNLHGLPSEDCWKLFTKHVFKKGHEHPDLIEIGREIVGKCRGHPLAIKSLSGILRSVRNPNDWRKISQNDIWESQFRVASCNDILPALWLSYYYLPPSMKRCFAYCSIFPKDYVIREEKVILLWVAEGILQPEKGKTIEDLGKEYFHGLLSRSLFQRSTHDESSITMHDLVHDLASFVAGESFLRLECDGEIEIPEKVRHLSCASTRNTAILKNFDSLCRAKSLRTFLPLKLSPSFSDYHLLTKKIIYDLLPNLPCLRVLSLGHYTSIAELPDSIGNLKHLRYLDLSETQIELLPASITSLYNLQTLLLSNCSSLVRLPHGMRRLINLRHLYIDGTKIKEIPPGLSVLKNLQILPVFPLGEGSGSDIRELNHLGNLRGKLLVLGLENVARPSDALMANFKNKKLLDEIALKWNTGSFASSQSQLEILENLCPHINLRKLTIENYNGKVIPNWLGDPSFTNMVFLSLANCKNCYILPPLGQIPFLKELSLTGFPEIQELGRDFYGRFSSVQPFRSLEILNIQNMAQLKKWVVDEDEKYIDSFRFLRELHIEDCPQMTGNLPCCLPSLTELVIIGCQELKTLLPEAPALHQLEMIHCEKMDLHNVPENVHFLTVVGQSTSEYMLEEIDCENSSLEALTISDCSSLRSLLEGGFPRTLKTLEITHCMKLELLMEQTFVSLESLTICYTCSSLRSLLLHSFPRLNRLHIEQCYNFESLSHSGKENGKVMTTLNFLQISRCPRFASFPGSGLLWPNLKWLWIEGCDNLEFFPEKMCSLLSSLQDLYISECPKLASFPEKGLPESLRTLSVSSCEKLIADRKNWNLPSLQHLSIGDSFEYFEGFPESWFLPSSLVSLCISELPNLQELEITGLGNLACLKELKILKCQALESLPIEKLPLSLEFVHISDCPLLMMKHRGRELAALARNVRLQLDDDSESMLIM